MNRVHLAGVLALSVCLIDGASIVRGQVMVPPPGPPPTRPPGAASREPALVTGRVVDGDTGSPVGAVVVSILGSGARQSPETPRVLTDASGRFFFADVPAGRYAVDANKAGWIPGSWGRNRPGGETQTIEIGAGETRRDVTIRLWRYAIVSGRVVDETGDPLVGTDVRIFRQGFAAGRRQFAFVTRSISDDRGMYRFTSLLPGDYVVVVPGTVSSEPPELREAATLPPIYLQTMTGVGTAPMSLGRADGGTGPGRPFVSSILSLPSMPLADEAWTTFATTFYPSTTSQTTAGLVRAVSGRERAGTDITIRFTRTFQVKGTLTLPNGAPAVFYAVHLVAAEAGVNPLANVATAVTDGRGAFTFYGVPPGDYVARVVRTPAPGMPGTRMGICGGTGAISYVCAPGGGPPGSAAIPVADEELLFADRSVVVADRHVDNVAITLAAGPRGTGRLEFEGASARPGVEAIRRMAVFFERADATPLQLQGGHSMIEPGRFADDGRLTMPSTWPGRYFIRVGSVPAGWFLKSVTHEGRDISENAFDLRTPLADVIVTLTDRQPKIEGSVQTASGQPDSSAIVLLFPAEAGARVDYGRTSRRVQSAAVTAGRYSLMTPPAGEYLLVAIPDDQSTDWQDPVRLERLAALAERVTVADGQSLTRSLRTRRLP